MPMIAPALAAKMLSATEQAPSAAIAMSALGTEISNYIMDNAIVMFAWAGIGPPPAFLPDPTVVATGKIKGVTIVLTPSGISNQSSALAMLGMQIWSGVFSAIYMVDSPWTCSPGVMMIPPMPPLTISGNNRQAAFNMMATQICTWITSWIPTIPCVGTHTIFTGIATPVKIM